MNARTYDVVVYGATGFTGQLVAEYLCELENRPFSWALAGRNRDKLEKVKAELTQRYPAAANIPIEVASADDRAGLDQLCQKTKVMCTTVGPYALYGTELVAACVEAKTHYCDLTGEVTFIRRMIDKHHPKAVENGVRIVHCCGFDSIPSDLGCMMVCEALLERHAKPTKVRFHAGESKGGVSGGTIASMLYLVEEAKKDKSVLRMVSKPYALNPEEANTGPDGMDQTGIRFDKEASTWTAPFVMAAINTRVVRRSMALRNFPYGRDFQYSEVMSTGRGMKGLVRAALMTGGLGAFLSAVQLGPLRSLLQARMLPKPGQGPSREARDNGFFVIRLYGEGKTSEGQDIRLTAEVRGSKDPGYGETAKMLAESALCLALDQERLPGGGGILTPASAMGEVLLDRLRRAGMTFEVR